MVHILIARLTWTTEYLQPYLVVLKIMPTRFIEYSVRQLTTVYSVIFKPDNPVLLYPVF